MQKFDISHLHFFTLDAALFRNKYLGCSPVHTYLGVSPIELSETCLLLLLLPGCFIHTNLNSLGTSGCSGHQDTFSDDITFSMQNSAMSGMLHMSLLSAGPSLQGPRPSLILNLLLPWWHLEHYTTPSMHDSGFGLLMSMSPNWPRSDTTPELAKTCKATLHSAGMPTLL